MNQPQRYLETPNQVNVKITLIIPVYFNAANIPVTWEAVRSILHQLPQWLDWEVLFVEDGSGDDSYSILKALQASEPQHVRVVKFTRNFGQVAAILAGLQGARGDCCIVMSADLQDPPELILEMLNRWSGGKSKIVVANRENREDGLITRLTSRIFYRMMQRYAISNMPQGGFDFFLIDKQVVDIVNRSDEKNSFLQGQILWTGYPIETIPYTRRKREIGRSRWTIAKKMKYFIDGFVSYSDTPIRTITILGLIVSTLSFAYATLIFLLKIFWQVPIEGWSPIMITMLMLGGVQLVMLGVIGEYIWRNSDETRKRPAFVIELELDEETNSDEAADGRMSTANR